jgi:hypothetical protein
VAREHCHESHANGREPSATPRWKRPHRKQLPETAATRRWPPLQRSPASAPQPPFAARHQRQRHWLLLRRYAGSAAHRRSPDRGCAPPVEPPAIPARLRPSHAHMRRSVHRLAGPRSESTVASASSVAEPMVIRRAYSFFDLR